MVADSALRVYLKEKKRVKRGKGSATRLKYLRVVVPGEAPHMALV
jgi:hypothetical protein